MGLKKQHRNCRSVRNCCSRIVWPKHNAAILTYASPPSAFCGTDLDGKNQHGSRTRDCSRVSRAALCRLDAAEALHFRLCLSRCSSAICFFCRQSFARHSVRTLPCGAYPMNSGTTFYFRPRLAPLLLGRGAVFVAQSSWRVSPPSRASWKALRDCWDF